MPGEVAQMFRVDPADVEPFNGAEDIYPGYPGIVVHQAEGRRVLRAMTWGFPRKQVSKKTGLPLKPSATNNARDDTLLSFFWEDSFIKRRCLIPLTAWAEAEGEKGRMTRTWYSLPGAELFAVAGIWRPTDEWGNAYSMVMVDGCPQMAEVHDRMPVIIAPEHHDQWMSGSVDGALALVRTCGDPLAVERSPEPWFRRKTPGLGPIALL